MLKESPFRLVALALGVGLLSAWFVACDIDGDTYSLNFTNDTQEMVKMCIRDCDSSPLKRQVEPGDYYRANGALGHPLLWQVRDQGDNILGCFMYDLDERPKIEERYVSTDLVPCP